MLKLLVYLGMIPLVMGYGYLLKQLFLLCKNKKESDNVKVVDYSDDGYKINKCIRYYDHEPKINIQTRKRFLELITNSNSFHKFCLRWKET